MKHRTVLSSLLFTGMAASWALFVSCSNPTTIPAQGAAAVKGALTTSGSVLFQDALASLDSSQWTRSNWGNGSMFNCGFVTGAVTFSGGTMTLTLDNTPSAGRPYSSGEYATNTAYGYGVYETSMKPAQASGIVSSFFLYTNSPVWDEIDIEFLGKDTTKVQFNYFVNGVGGHEHLHTLGFDASQGFHTYSIDYQSTGIRWYVDGVLAYTVSAGAGVTLPSHSMKVFANLWPGTGVDTWLGPFSYSSPLTASYDSFKGSSGVVTGVVAP